MKKKILGFGIATLTMFASLGSLMAANSLQIVSKGVGNKNISTDGSTYLTNDINEANTDLSAGSVSLDVTIHNSKDIEVIYAFVNSTSFAANKTDVAYKIKEQYSALTSKKVSQDVVYTTGTGIYNGKLEDSTLSSKLDKLNTETANDNVNYLFDLLTTSANVFSDSAKEKYIMLFTSTLPTLTTEETTRLTNLVSESITNKNITLIVYAVDSTDTTTTLTSIFGSNVKAISSTNYSGININDVLVDSYVTKKENLNTEILFDDYIVNNFEVKNVTSSKGSVVYDQTNKKLILSSITLDANEDLKISYTLVLKSEIDSSILQVPKLRTDRQIKVSFTAPGGNVIGNFPADNKIEDDICSPLIKVVEGTVANPETGVYNYVIAGACMLAVALMTLVILSNKNQFNRI